MDQVIGALLIFTLVPVLGALPLTGWIVRLLTGKQLAKIGTGNVGVSAAFYHGGTAIGLLSVAAEAMKGIVAVLIARYFFGGDPIWPVLSLIFLVMGRYWGSQGAGTTNVAWGFLVYDPVVTGLVFLISLFGFTVFRMRQQGRLLVLVLMPVLTALRHPTDGMRVLIVACLSGLIAWIYQKIPDDLEMPATHSAGDSRRLFRFFQGDRALKSLSTVLSADEVGNKAATLSQLYAWGYPVPPGYVLPAGDDPAALIAAVSPSAADPVVARSSAIGEDSLTASAAGQYVSVTEITSTAALGQAIAVCFEAYNRPSALRYRRDRGLPEGKMTVLVQPYITGVFSGVAFSRDPITQARDVVAVEALPGGADRVVSGQTTPERYQVSVGELSAHSAAHSESWELPPEETLPVNGQGQVPLRLIQQVAYLARHIENSCHGVPQDIEWTFDGEQLWVLQSRPITTLLPIWTRKIAAEVIPGVIRPLTWSINQPLTCGVWGDLFTTVLKDRAADLDFSQTATLHYARAYFNATLLGDIFTRMGLPPDSLEFLTRGAKFSRPPLLVTLRNAPGLLRLLRQEMSLPAEFAQADQSVFSPALKRWRQQPLAQLSEGAIAERIDEILSLLEHATYFNILAPLSLALRQAIFKVDLAALDSRRNPELRALEDLKKMAAQLRSLLPELGLSSDISTDSDSDTRTPPSNGASLFAALSEHPDGQLAFDQLDQFLDEYGYLSEVATDIAVPTWRESPQPVRELLTQYLFDPPAPPSAERQAVTGWRDRQVQARLDLKGRVAEVYNRLLALLRSCFVTLENHWLNSKQLALSGDVFFLTWADIRTQITAPLPATELQLKVDAAKALWQRQGKYRAPYLVYGQAPPVPVAATPLISAGILRGIGASAGQIEGTVRVLENLADAAEFSAVSASSSTQDLLTVETQTIDAQTILVVPYTDAGWSPLLARIGGLVAEVGGQLSHGAIVAREYGIPAVMDVTDATQRLTTGQRVRIDGQHGTIEIL